MSVFKRAEKSQSKLRLALFGPSGAGKTYTALRIATGMGKRIAVFDTESESASKYADRFVFDTVNLTDNANIDGLIEMFGEAAKEGYDVVILDSMSHSWHELLEEIDMLAKSKYRGNTWSAWSEGTPKQKKLIKAIVSYPGHVIATMRSKTEWTTTQGSDGKSRPQRVGLAPEAGKGIEYEFDMLMEMSTDHIANIIKDRTGKFQDKLIEKPGEDFGIELMEWLGTGKAVDLTDFLEAKTKVLQIVSENEKILTDEQKAYVVKKTSITTPSSDSEASKATKSMEDLFDLIYKSVMKNMEESA